MRRLFALACLAVAIAAGCGRGDAPQFELTDVTGAKFGQKLELTDHNGERRSLADFKGKVVVVFFGFTHCPDACPTTMLELANVVRDLGPDAARVQVLFVTVDPERDTPEVLRAFMQEKNLDESRWTLLNGSPGDVREFAALLGVRYRPMGTSDIAHSNMITVLDEDGVIRYQMKGLSESVELVVDAIADVAGRNGA